MLLNTFRSQQPANYIIISGLALLLWLPVLVSGPAGIPEFHPMPVYAWFTEFLPGRLGAVIALLLVIAEAFYLNYLINKYEVLYKPSFLPALMYILLMSFSRSVMWLHPPVFVNLFLLIFLDRAFALFKHPTPSRLLFECSFFTGLALLFHFPSFVYYLLLLLALGIIRSLSARQWMITLTGFFLPLYFACVWFFWKGTLNDMVASLTYHAPDFRMPIVTWSAKSGVEIVLVSLLALLSLFRLRAHFYKNTIRTRSNQRIFVYTLFASAASILLTRSPGLYHLTLFALPLSVFIAYYFLSFRTRAWIGEVLFGAFAVAIIVNLF